MSGAERFLDTNVLLYLVSDDPARADRAEDEVAAGGVVSVQVLNEFAAAATRKLGLSVAEVREILGSVREICEVASLTADTYDRALDLAQRYRLGIHDATIVASAHLAGCRFLVSEDLPHGQRFGSLVVRNPFRDLAQ